MNFTFLIILILLIIFFRKKKINLNNPLFFFWSTWIITILICLLNIFSAYNKLSLKTYLYLFLYLLVTTFGFILGKSLSFANVDIKYTPSKLVVSFNILFLLVCCAYILTIIKLGLPPAISGADRSTYYLGNGGELIYLLIYPCFFLGLILFREIPLIKILPQLIVLSIIVLSRGNKMTIFTIVLMIFYLYGRKIKLINIILFLIFVLVVFYFSTYIYTKNVTDKYLLQTTRVLLTGFTLPNNFYFLYDPLIYFSSNLYNLNNLINLDLSFIGHGLISFKSITQILGAFNPSVTEHYVELQNILNSSLTVPIFNTYSGLGLLYFDFGIILTLAIMLVIGILTGGIYKNKEKSNVSLTTNFFGFILYQTLALSFFTFYLGNLEVLTNLIIMFIISLIAKKHT